MRFILGAAAFAALLAFHTDRAEAQFIYGDDLVFVQEVDGFEQDLSLCILNEQVTFLWIVSLWRYDLEYVLAEDRCRMSAISDTDVYTINSDDFAQLQNEGILPRDLTYEPQWTIGLILRSFWGLAIGGVFVGLIAFAYLRTLTSNRREERKYQEALTMLSPDAMLVMSLMLAARDQCPFDQLDKADDVIIDLGRRMGKPEFSQKHVDMLTFKGHKAKIEDIPALSANVEDRTKVLAVDGVLRVLCSDGKLDQNESNHVGRVAGALGFSQEEFDKIYQNFVKKFNEERAG